MTTATLVTHGRTMDTAVERPRRSLEELVDRLFAAMGLTDEPEVAEEPTATRSIHEARRFRQAGDVDTALAMLGGVDPAKATTREVRWAFSEWKALVKRRLGGRGALLYSQGHWQGLGAGSQRRRDAGGRCGPGNALAARQGRLGAQPPGAQAPERLP